MSENTFPILSTSQILEPTPESCLADGLSCEECVGASARALAEVCHGLRGTALGSLFTQMYPGTACARMHRSFKAAYREASLDRLHAQDPEPVQEPVAAEPVCEDPGFTRVDMSTRRAMAAYA